MLWLSEGALGPDEHNLVVEAIEALSADTSLLCHENGLEDGRVAIFLPVRAPRGDLVGLAMILADLKSVGDGVLERMVTPQVRTIMQKIAVLLRGAIVKPNGTGETGLVPVLEMGTAAAASAHQIEWHANLPAAGLVPSNTPTASAKQAPSGLLTPEAVADILEFELIPDVAPAGAKKLAAIEIPYPSVPTLSAPATSRAAAPLVAPVAVTPPAPSGATTPSKSLPQPGAAAAPKSTPPSGATTTSRSLGPTASTTASRVVSANDSAQLLLEVQPYAKLRAGGRSRRFEVQVRTPHRDASRDSAALDAHALQRLLSWLSVNRGTWNLEPTSFTLNLSIATLEDERFPQNVAAALKNHGIAPDTIGFEIAEPLCTQRRAQVERFIALCDKIGCFIVIDDFSLDSTVLPLLRSKALRLVKIDPKLTGVALKDKLAQALVVAIAQAVKVLGIHCSAKRVESQAALQWLTAIGCDFAQGSAVSQLQPLEALLAPAAGVTESNRP